MCFSGGTQRTLASSRGTQRTLSVEVRDDAAKFHLHSSHQLNCITCVEEQPRPLHALCLRPPRAHHEATAVAHPLPLPPRTFTSLPRESLVPAAHAATFSAVRRIHGPCWYHEWCGPEEDGDRGQERAGAPAILRVACGVQACAIGHSCSGAPSMRSYRGR